MKITKTERIKTKLELQSLEELKPNQNYKIRMKNKITITITKK